MNKVDPISVSTIWHFIQRVCREMRETTEKTATNVLVVTLHDLAYGIWDANARAIAIPEGIPPRLIASSFPIRRVKEKFKGNIFPGDEFLTNYPLDGAIHLPDWVFIRPIFYKEELLFFTCMGTHVPDNGGAMPGTHFLAVDSIGEGLNIPLIKIAEKGQLREDVLELILANNRLPEMMRREITSLIGSTALAERRMIELLDKYGKDTVLASLEDMIQRTEKAVRAKMAEWPEGTYSAEAKTDDDGIQFEVPVTVRCTLTIKNGELTFDFSGSDAQVKGMMNSYYHQTYSNTLCGTFLFLGTELAEYHNEGSLKPVHLITKKGTIVDCKPGALVAAAPAVTGGLVLEAVLSVLSQALKDTAIAPYSRKVGTDIIGQDPRTGGLYVYISPGAFGGAGAVSGYDGYQCGSDMASLGLFGKTDAEEEMVRFPWEVERYEFRTDAHGAGKWRGSPGIVWEGVNQGGQCTCVGGGCDGFITQGMGQQGGEPTPFNQSYVLSGDKKIPANKKSIVMQKGDRRINLSGGGAGVGRPEERDPEAVKEDVEDELVSLKMARNVYKVVLDPDTFEIDYDATRKLRNK